MSENSVRPESVLVARDLHIAFSSRRGRPPARAVDGVNLAVGRSEIVALIGESGCGKSTLARALLGLVKPTSGKVLYEGKELSYSSSGLKAYRRHVQLVLQDPGGSLNPRQTVFQAVAEGPKIHRLREGLDARVNDALSRVGLRPPENYLERYPRELSGGQQQRVVIAGALALNPSVIIADEPVSSLDASIRGEILKLILSLRQDLSLSALVISHDLGLAWNIADRVAVMYLGRIVEVGTVEQVLLDPQHPYTKALISVLPNSKGTGIHRVIPSGEPPDPTAIPSGCRFHPRCPKFASLASNDPLRNLCISQPPAIIAIDALRANACHLASAGL